MTTNSYSETSIAYLDLDFIMLKSKAGISITNQLTEIKKKNIKIPKSTKAEELSLEDCMKLIKDAPETKARRGRKK